MINRSESITKLAVALAKFNMEVGAISKDANNPFFKSAYVTLDKLIESTRDILSKNGLTVMQFPTEKEGMVGVVTMLMHESGEYIESTPLYLKPVKNDPQAYGSAVTYARRYSYQAILNLNTGEDDDGNSCSNPQGANSRPSGVNGTGLTEAQIKRLYAIGSKAGFAKDMILKAVKKDYNVEKPELLNKTQYDELCSRLEKKVK